MGTSSGIYELNYECASEFFIAGEPECILKLTCLYRWCMTLFLG